MVQRTNVLRRLMEFVPDLKMTWVKGDPGERKLGSTKAIDVLTDLFISRGTPAYIRSDNGPEFVATAVKLWITGLAAKPAYIEPGSPWENGCVESFNGKFRDELLACEAFNTLAEAKVLIEQWRVRYNTARPHNSLGY